MNKRDRSALADAVVPRWVHYEKLRDIASTYRCAAHIVDIGRKEGVPLRQIIEDLRAMAASVEDLAKQRAKNA